VKLVAEEQLFAVGWEECCELGKNGSSFRHFVYRLLVQNYEKRREGETEETRSRAGPSRDDRRSVEQVSLYGMTMSDDYAILL